MKKYIFLENNTLKRLDTSIPAIHSVLDHVAAGTDTQHLVVSLYIVHKTSWTGGTAYCHSWLTPKEFFAVRGKWRIRTAKIAPSDLPQRYKLIRLKLTDSASYPLIERDLYHWQHHYQSFADHLAFLFAHELHHFRRYHCGLHPGEGEHGANRWACAHAQNIGYAVQSKSLPPPARRKKAKANSFAQVLNPQDFFKDLAAPQVGWRKLIRTFVSNISVFEQRRYVQEKYVHFEQMRKLPVGTVLQIRFDPSNRYLRQKAKLVRPLRRNSIRIVIETMDGKQWRWPMAWLSVFA